MTETRNTNDSIAADFIVLTSSRRTILSKVSTMVVLKVVEMIQLILAELRVHQVSLQFDQDFVLVDYNH